MQSQPRCQRSISQRDDWIVLGASLFTIFISLFTILWS